MDNTTKDAQKGNRLRSHIALLIAMSLFGLMTPFGKDAMNSGINGMQMAGFRIMGTAILLWLISPITGLGKIRIKDLWLLAGASILGITLAQSLVIVGLSMTSPINASVELLSQPIFVLILAAIILGNKITVKKGLGVLFGSLGALILVMATHKGGGETNIIGDLLVLGSQLSFAFYLTIFRRVIRRYDSITINRVLFTFAAFFFIPFMWSSSKDMDWSAVNMRTCGEIGYIIVFCTFVTFLLVIYAQKSLQPTVISVYNYLVPVISTIASCIMGLATFGLSQGLASALIIIGVTLTTHGTRNAKGEK